jgi:hypothetical protein
VFCSEQKCCPSRRWNWRTVSLVWYHDGEDNSPPYSSSSSAHCETTAYCEGSCDLWCPEDEEFLSPLHCFLRKYCVEAATANVSGSAIFTSKSGRSSGRTVAIDQVRAIHNCIYIVNCVVLSHTYIVHEILASSPSSGVVAWWQVGIQCKWCKHRNYKERQGGAVCFPLTIKNIYFSLETWLRRHATVCSDIAPWAKAQLTKLTSGARSIGVSRQGRRLYWEESAKRLGMVDTDNGIRFFRPTGTIDPLPLTNNLPVQHSHPIVHEDDLELLQRTGFLFYLLEQMETCYFSEEDRMGDRSKVKSCQLGYPGYVHCWNANEWR